MLYACDEEWWARWIDDVRETFSGELWTQSPVAERRFGVRRVAGSSKPGLSRDPEKIHTGGNSGYQAINLVYHFGVKRIVLIGFDMQRRNGRTHWHGNHPGSMNKASPYKSWVKRFGVLAQDLKQEGVEVVNCSEHTALDCFPTARIEDVL